MFVPSRVSKEDYTYKSHKSDILIMQYVIVSDIKCFNKVLIYRKIVFFLYICRAIWICLDGILN